MLREHLPTRPKTIPYTASITRNTPALILILLDHSSSMRSRILYKEQLISKSEAVAQVVDQLLKELLNRCRKLDGVRDYFNISLLGYGGRLDADTYIAWEEKLAEKKFVLPAQIDAHPLNVTKVLTESTIRGEKITFEKEIRSWVKPVALGDTPMLAGLQFTLDIIREWTRSQVGKNVFPPVVFHITDGMASDGTMKEIVAAGQAIKDTGTSDGNTIFYNIHLSTLGRGTVIFPSNLTDLPPSDHFAPLLYEMSSDLPDAMRAEANLALNQPTETKLKAMGYNTGIEEVVKLLNIGTSTSFARLVE